MSRSFLVPLLLPADPTLAMEAATKQYVDAIGAGGIGTVNAFTFNSTTTAPPTGNQVRFNNATQSATTLIWISQTTFDGLDVSIGLSRITANYQLYMQDYDDSSAWIMFNVTANGTDLGAYWSVPVTYSAGPGVPTQKIAMQTITPANAATAPVRRVIKADTTTGYTPILTDENQMVTLSNAGAITVTMPQNSAVAFPVGAEIDFLWLGAGQPTFTNGTGATVNGTPGLKLRAQYSAATAKKISTNGWVIIGDLSA